MSLRPLSLVLTLLPFLALTLAFTSLASLPGCNGNEAGDDDSATDDDTTPAEDDDTTPADHPPVISSLDISLEEVDGADSLVFRFHYEDPDADIAGGDALIFTNGEEAASAHIPSDYEPFTAGDLELNLELRDDLTYGAMFLFGVSLLDASGHESNRLELEYTIPDA